MHKVFLVTILFFAMVGHACAAGLANAVTTADFDFPNCAAYEGTHSLGPGDPDTIAYLFGVGKPGGTSQWSTTKTGEKKRCFRIAFKQPVAIGTICTEYTGPVSQMFHEDTGRMVAYLKAGATYPGDVNDDSQWVTLAAGAVKALPPGVSTRALRFEDLVAAPAFTGQISSLGQSLLITGRYYCALNLGVAKSSVSGGAQPTDTTWLGYWNDPQKVEGIAFLEMQAKVLSAQTFKATAALHPLISADSGFQNVTEVDGNQEPAVVAFPAPVTTTAIRLVKVTGTVLLGNFGEPLPLVDLGHEAEVPSIKVPPAPFKLHYTMPLDGFVAIHIMDHSGALVRRLVAEVPRPKGPVTEAWDLKDDNGEYVHPGSYSWKILARPPLKLTYEGTVNNSGQPAWWAPAPSKGGGGWLADHGVPVSACAVGDDIFLGASVAESGHSAIAVDKNGNKLWGEGYVIQGFAGADRIATDGKYAYLVNYYGIERVDPANGFTRRTIMKFNYTRDLPSSDWNPVSSGGVAIKGDKLYLSCNGPGVPWLQSSFISDLIDTDNCMPLIRLDRGRRDIGPNTLYAESEYDELQRLYAAFLTGADPDSGPSLPRVDLPSSTQAYFGDASTNGPLSGSLTLSFKKPVPVGSVLVSDPSVLVYALKSGVALTSAIADPDPDAATTVGGDVDKFDDAIWTPLTTTGVKGSPAIALTKAGIFTQALRFKAKRIAYAMVMSRRFSDVAGSAKRVYADGADSGYGGWAVDRPATNPITPLNSPAMALVWPQAVTIRGVTFIRPSTATMLVDTYIGPDSKDPASMLEDDSAWRNVGEVRAQIYRGYWAEHASAQNVDFGDMVETRALRIHAIAPEGSLVSNYSTVAVTTDHIAGFESIVAYTHLGGDPELPPSLSQRLTEIRLPTGDSDSATIVRQIPMARPGYLAFDKAGTLYAESAGSIVTMPLSGDAKPSEVIAKAELDSPAGMTFGPDGLLYVADVGPNVVKVFDVNTGKQVRPIGKPGGLSVGPYDPDHMYRPTGVAIDSAGKLWVAENSFAPKRISRWRVDGVRESFYTGPTSYGGGGRLDPGNKSVLNYDGMKFVMDWTTRTSKLDSLLFIPGHNGIVGAYPDRPFYRDGHRYLAGDGGGNGSSLGSGVSIIAIEKDGLAEPIAAAGRLSEWEALLHQPAFAAKFGKLQLAQYGFVWTDTNGDHIPQPDEIQITQKDTFAGPYWSGRVGEDLSFNFHSSRLRPTTIKADGTPVYDINQFQSLAPYGGESWTTADGRRFVMGNDGDRLLSADGKTVQWFYPDDYFGVQGSHRIGYDRAPGQLVGEFQVVGHLTVGNEELFVTNANHGDWYVFTADGMLAGCIFGGPGQYGKRWWTMPEWIPGTTDLSDLNVGEEHFAGCVVKAEDGKVYAVAGHNHNSIVRVDGLESLQRIVPDPVAVAAGDVDLAQKWAVAKASAERAMIESKVAKVPYLSSITVDGSLDDWDPSLFVNAHEVRDDNGVVTSSYDGALAFDSDKLYVAASSTDINAFNNGSQDLNTLFKTGGAFEVDLGLDPAADPKRNGPADGDIRLLFARVNGKPVAVLYRPSVPGTPPASRVLFRSIADTYIDVVKVIDNPDMVVKPDPDDKIQYPSVLEAAIPWKDIGLPAPHVGTKLRADIGFLIGDQNGVRTVDRYYWAGKTQTVVADLATEARITPSLWGDMYFLDADTHTLQGPDAAPGLDAAP